jgi:hypothetical protein
MKRNLLLAAIAIPLLMLGARAASSIWTPNGETEFVGKAIDKTTDRTVPNAWVLAIYILGSGGAHEQAHCTVAELVKSNDRGEYELPYYDGLPPQFFFAFAHRYKWASWPRVVYRDANLRPIVEILKIVNGNVQKIGQEGPFASEQEALKASRILQDVWLEPFVGTDDEWLRHLRSTPNHAGCKSRRTSGMVGWAAALLAEAEAMPDSEVKRQVVRSYELLLEHEKMRNPEGAQRLSIGVSK